MKDQFVTYEIAKKLKELGFNEECIGYFGKNYLSGKDNDLYLADRAIKATKFKEKYLAAPLWQQVIDWLREKHNIRIADVTNSVNSKETFFMVWNNAIKKSTGSSHKNYYKAREAAILKALELISK